jgi:hypothetical protein
LEFQIVYFVDLHLEYRASRVNWENEGPGLTQEWGLGLSIDLFPVPPWPDTSSPGG